MILAASGARVWLAVGHTYVRHSMNGPALQVQQALRRDPPPMAWQKQEERRAMPREERRAVQRRGLSASEHRGALFAPSDMALILVLG